MPLPKLKSHDILANIDGFVGKNFLGTAQEASSIAWRARDDMWRAHFAEEIAKKMTDGACKIYYSLDDVREKGLHVSPGHAVKTLKTIKQKAEELGFSARTVQWLPYDGDLYNEAHEDCEGVPMVEISWLTLKDPSPLPDLIPDNVLATKRMILRLSLNTPEAGGTEPRKGTPGPDAQTAREKLQADHQAMVRKRTAWWIERVYLPFVLPAAKRGETVFRAPQDFLSSKTRELGDSGHISIRVGMPHYTPPGPKRNVFPTVGEFAPLKGFVSRTIHEDCCDLTGQDFFLSELRW